MVELYREGLAWNEIRDRLVEEGLPLRSGNGIRSTLARNGYGYEAPQLSAESVVRIVELYGQGMSSNRIAEFLNEEGVPTLKRVGRWHGPTVTGLLRREGVLTRSRTEAVALLRAREREHFAAEREGAKAAREAEREAHRAEREAVKMATKARIAAKKEEREQKRKREQETKARFRELAERANEAERLCRLDPTLLRASRAAHPPKIVRRAARPGWF